MTARVLIVDDDPANVAMLEAFLSEDAESIQSGASLVAPVVTERPARLLRSGS